MLRRISVIVATAAMLALSAMPALATSHSSTQKLSFPTLHGVQAWGHWQMTKRGVKLYVCTKDNANYFAVGAVALASNSSNKLVTTFGAVALGPGTTQCRGPVTLRLTGHLRIYTVIFGSNGKILQRSAVRKIY